MSLAAYYPLGNINVAPIANVAANAAGNVLSAGGDAKKNIVMSVPSIVGGILTTGGTVATSAGGTTSIAAAAWGTAAIPIVGAAVAGVTVALMVVTLLRARCLPTSRALGAGAALSVVLSPLAEQYHFLVVLAPLSVAASLRLDLRRAALFALAGAMLTVDLPFKSPALWNGATALLAYPRLYGALIVWGLLVFAPAPSTLEQGTT